jgi:hypothetical protein
MIKPRTIVQDEQPQRPTVIAPKTGPNFVGWGPRLRF